MRAIEFETRTRWPTIDLTGPSRYQRRPLCAGPFLESSRAPLHLPVAAVYGYIPCKRL